MPHEGPPWNRIRPEGLRTGGPQLTAGHGRPVCQPWWNGDKAEGQHPEAMCFAGSTPQNLQSTLHPDDPVFYLAWLERCKPSSADKKGNGE